MGAPLPDRLEYHELQRAGGPGIWRPLLGAVVAVVGVFVAATTFWLLVFLAYYASQGVDLDVARDRLSDIDNPTPGLLAFLFLSLASAIPLTLLLMRLLHGMRPGFLSSVRPRLRWGYLAVCVLLSFVTLFVTVVLGSLVPTDETTAELSGELNAWTTQTRDFLLVVLLLTPFQAAGEEYLFRGYLTQAFGGVFGRLSRTMGRVLAVVGPALLFALVHGSDQSVPVFFDRFAFGLVAGVLVIVTGGLEAGIALHVVNNLLAFGIALAYADMGDTLSPGAGSWWDIPVTIVKSLLYLGLALAVARRMGLATTADPAVLAASGSPVYRVPSARA